MGDPASKITSLKCKVLSDTAMKEAASSTESAVGRSKALAHLRKVVSTPPCVPIGWRSPSAEMTRHQGRSNKAVDAPFAETYVSASGQRCRGAQENLLRRLDPATCSQATEPDEVFISRTPRLMGRPRRAAQTAASSPSETCGCDNHDGVRPDVKPEVANKLDQASSDNDLHDGYACLGTILGHAKYGRSIIAAHAAAQTSLLSDRLESSSCGVMPVSEHTERKIIVEVLRKEEVDLANAKGWHHMSPVTAKEVSNTSYFYFFPGFAETRLLHQRSVFPSA